MAVAIAHRFRRAIDLDLDCATEAFSNMRHRSGVLSVAPAPRCKMAALC
jgi:hypothetical protein